MNLMAALEANPLAVREYRACLRKRPWRHRKAAKEMAAVTAKRVGVPMTFYRCEQCGQFHICKVGARKG